MLDSDHGLFQTWQYSLYRALMNRLRLSEFRTRDPSKATAFVIPYDIGINSYIDNLTGEPRLAAPHGRLAYQLLKEHCSMEQREIFWKNSGHDHFILNALTFGQMIGIAAKEFYMQICQNCTVICVETSPTKTAATGRTRKGWFASPYPSSFHWHEGIKYLPWKVYSEGEPGYIKRDIFVLFIGRWVGVGECGYGL